MSITVTATVNSTIESVWIAWVTPEHIKNWNHASNDWHTTVAEVDLKVGGKFFSRMEAKDGSYGFDFTGIFSKVIDRQLIEYAMEDGRKVSITFKSSGGSTQVTETFDAEEENSIEVQQMGWQSILNNFAKYAESLK